MGGYIGARAGTLSTTVANVQDVTATDTTPEVTIINNTHEDSDGGREGKLIFKGQQSGGEESTLAEIEAHHDGTSDDEKGDLIFRTNDGSDGASPTTAMVIDSAQNVGIGNNAPTEFLTLGDTSDSASRIQFLSTTSGANTIHFGDGSSAAAYVGYINYAHDTNSLQFAANGAERMRLTDAGNLLLGTSTVQGQGHTFTFGGTYPQYNIVAGVTTSLQVIQFRNPNGKIGTIVMDGSSTTYNTSSDYRLKENVTNISDGITRVKQLAPKRFNFIADADKTVDGFLAHEAATVVPEAITGTKDEVEVWADGDELPDGVSVGDNKLDDDGNTIPVMQGIDQSKLVPLLTAALQEAIAKIETLETKVAALEAG